MTWETDYIWATGDELPSASQIRKARDRIRRAAAKGQRPEADDLYLLDKFRAWHGVVHNNLQLRLGAAVD